MAIRQRHLGSIICLDVDGRLVMGGQDGVLRDEVNRLFLKGHRDILLNLREVSQVDTSGIAALTAVRAAAERYGGTIKLLNLPRRIYDMLVITKLITAFEVFESEVDALGSYSPNADVQDVTD
jgi:anti-sigma B factor antagonist